MTCSYIGHLIVQQVKLISHSVKGQKEGVGKGGSGGGGEGRGDDEIQKGGKQD